MKTLIAILICLTITLSINFAIAGDNQIYPITTDKQVQRNTTSQIICVDGYKYLVTQSQSERPTSQTGFGVSVVQMFETVKNFNPPQPVKCKE